MISLIIIVALIMLLNAFFDYWIINEKDVYIDHAKSTFIWMLVYTVCIGLWYFDNIDLRPFLLRVVVALPFVRWLIHDLVLNGLRGKEWDYLSTGEKAALTDKLLVRFPFHFIWLKLGLIILAFSLIIIL